MPINRRKLLAVGASGLLVPPAASARGRGELIANVIDIAPWGRAGANAAVEGVYAEIFKRLAQLSGCSIELRLTPIKRAVAEVTSGFTQATIMLERDDLNRGAIVLGAVTTLEIEVWLPKLSSVRTLSQLTGKTVVTLRGPAYHEEIDANNLIVKYPVAGARQQLEMVRAGRAEGALGVRQNFLVALRELGWQDDLFSEPIRLGSRRVLLWVSQSLRGQPCEEKLRHALARMLSSGEIDRLIARAINAAP
jgi:ABC-type amino acid transport substrate-binding protein